MVGCCDPAEESVEASRGELRAAARAALMAAWRSCQHRACVSCTERAGRAVSEGVTTGVLLMGFDSDSGDTALSLNVRLFDETRMDAFFGCVIGGVRFVIPALT